MSSYDGKSNQGKKVRRENSCFLNFDTQIQHAFSLMRKCNKTWVTKILTWALLNTQSGRTFPTLVQTRTYGRGYKRYIVPWSGMYWGPRE